MPSVKTTPIVGICLLLGFGGFIVFRSRSGPPENIEAKTTSPVVAPEPKKDKPKAKVARPEDPVRGNALRGLTHRWEVLAGSGGTGEDLLAKQKLLAMEAVAQLGPSDELLRFLDFLSKQGANDVRNWVLKTGAAELFMGAGGKAAREWVVTLEDRKLREAFGSLAGSTFKGTSEEMKTYLAAFGGDDHGQSAVLTGYCSTLAKSDPEGGIAAFRALRPPKVEMGGIAGVMAALPATADFVKISGSFPDDSKSLAKNARSALLEAWTTANPQAAAQYVLANGTLASPPQMGVVVTTWADSDSQAAATWVAGLSPGNYRDEGAAALVKHWNSRDPSKAWEYVGEVSDMDRRIATATLVFKEWSKTDSAAATQAWTTLFPQK